MKRRDRAPWLMLSLALFVAVGWLAAEAVLRLDQVPETPDALCRATAFPVPRLEAARLLRTEGRTLITYDPRREALVLSELTGAAGKNAVRTLRDVSLRCRQPGYHCFPAASADGPESLEPRMLDATHGLIRARLGDHVTDFPFQWDDQGLRLAGPLNFCARPLSWKPSHLALAQSQIVAMDADGARFGLFPLPEFRGALWREVPREPERVWGFDDKFSFREAACGEASPAARLALGTFDGRLWFLKDDPAGSEFLLADLSAGLQPLRAPGLNGTWRSVHTVNEKNLLLEGTGAGDWARVSWTDAGPQITRSPAAALSGGDAPSFRAGPAGGLLRVSSGRWLAGPRLELIPPAGPAQAVAEGPGAWRAETPEQWDLAELTPREFVWILPSKKGVDLRKLDCAGGLKAPNK